MALAALETGKRSPSRRSTTTGYFWFGNHKFRDDKDRGHGVVDMYRSIVSPATPTTTCWPTTWAWT
jgi:penicillin-binding protein 2